ncbi:MAG: hypothetical protein PHF57_13585 [Methanoregula sp.]|nr:hypothetical protein [Methanoregula sp.]
MSKSLHEQGYLEHSLFTVKGYCCQKPVIPWTAGYPFIIKGADALPCRNPGWNPHG